jgi:hypothetical protein
MSIVSKKIRNVPRDIDVVCVNCANPECCWAHLPYKDSGTGQKTDDIYGAPLCHKCHDYADGRADFDSMGHRHSETENGTRDYEWRYRVMRRGLMVLIKAGALSIN